MQYVLASGQYKRLHQRLTEIQNDLNINITKVEPTRVFFDIDSSLPVLETIRQIKIKIYEDKRTWEMVFQIFPVYDGVIDYLPYMEMETKQDKYSYYKRDK